jgi:hypothetical protein
MKVKSGGRIMNPLLIASVAFALFVLCPRMAGMANVIADATQLNLILVTVIGTLISLPLIVLMVIIFNHYGLWAALAFAVITDVLAAVVMGAISWKSSLETFIIAIFVIVGVRVATIISAKITWS